MIIFHHFIMANHSICADPGATDDRWSWGGHLRTNEIKIMRSQSVFFSRISRDRVEIETHKWC